MTWADLNEYAAFNRDFLNAVQAGRSAGKTVDEIANSWMIPSSYTDYRPPQPVQLKRSIQVIIDELDGSSVR